MSTPVSPLSNPTGLINRISNGDLALNPEGSIVGADGTTCFVSYTRLSQSNPIGTQQLTAPESGQNCAVRITQPNASAQRVGICQTIPSVDCVDLRQFPAACSFRMNTSVSGRVIFALLEWDGTADTSPADPILNWDSASYTPGQFFKSTFKVVNTGACSAPTGAWFTAPYVPFQVGAGMNNLVLVIWTENPVAQNATLDLGLISVISGDNLLPFEHRPAGIQSAVAYPISPDMGPIVSANLATARKLFGAEEILVTAEPFNAPWNGTDDDYTAIQAAITYAIGLNRPAYVICPQGVGRISLPIEIDTTLQASSQVVLTGVSREATIVRALPSFVGQHLVRFGPGTASTTRARGGVTAITLDGNSVSGAASVAGLRIRNAYTCEFTGVRVMGCAGDGIASSGNPTGAPGSDPLNQGNIFNDLYAQANGGYGIYMRGEKASLLQNNQSDGNTLGGMFLDSETVGANTETTENNVTVFTARNNLGPGLALSGAAKLTAGTIHAHINAGPAVALVATRSGTTSPTLFSSIAQIVSRNNEGALVTAAGANIYCDGCDFTSIVHVGGYPSSGPIVEATAINALGFDNCTFGDIVVESNYGTAMHIGDQAGGRVSAAIGISNAILRNNGNASAATNNGLMIDGSTTAVTVNSINLANSFTTAAANGYELVCGAGVTNININSASITASQSGREVSISNYSNVSLGGRSVVAGLQSEIKPTGLSAVSSITALGTYAREFWDNASPAAKWARMPDGTLRLLSATRFKIVRFTLDTSLANTATVAVTGVGFQPTFIVALTSQTANTWMSAGFDDGSSHLGTFGYNNAGTVFSEDNAHSIVKVASVGVTESRWAVTSMDADGFTLTHAKTGSPTGSLVVNCIAMQ